MDSIGSRLAKFRKSLGKNQIPFAKELGVSQSAYANYERGATDIPLSLAIKLSSEYGLPLDQLVFGVPTLSPLNATECLKLVLDAVSDFEEKNNFRYSPERRNELIIFLFEETISGRVIRPEQMQKVMQIGK